MLICCFNQTCASYLGNALEAKIKTRQLCAYILCRPQAKSPTMCGTSLSLECVKQNPGWTPLSVCHTTGCYFCNSLASLKLGSAFNYKPFPVNGRVTSSSFVFWKLEMVTYEENCIWSLELLAIIIKYS